MPKVSIICPVYKAEKYIHRCLDSIQQQTFTDWECILVDDGSPDTSGAICDEYAANDSRFKVIHKENGGVSAARQTGFDAACGEYIIHADPDDYVESTMLKELYKKAKQDDADMVICDFYYDIEGKAIYHKQQPSLLMADKVLHDLFGKLHGSCWNKLVRRSCCVKYNAKFPEGVNYCEDVCFNVQLLKHDIKIAYLPKAFYHYVQYETSITNNFTLKTLDVCKKYVEVLSTILPEDSVMVQRAKGMVKCCAFRYELLKDDEITQLYPEVNTYSQEHAYLRPVYAMAFAGHQAIARYILNSYLVLAKFLLNIYKKI